MYRAEQKYYGVFFENLKKIQDLGLAKHHPTRVINSIYYDTNDLQFFKLSEEGSTPRQKIRIRWYGNFNNIKIENKSKEFDFSKKFFFDIGVFDIKKINFYIMKFTNQKIFPKLKVSYSRKYFIDRSSQTRYTLDYNINYFKVDNKYRSVERCKSKFSIIEVKKNINNREIQSTSILGNKRARHSKYCEGIKEFY